MALGLYKAKQFAHLHARSPITEVDAAVKAVRGEWQYAKDDVFGEAVLRDIVTYEQGKAFMQTIIADRHAMDENKKWTCSKARTIKDSLDYWKKSKSPWRGTVGEAIASARRTCCGCHETGSFALSNTYHERMKRITEKEKVKRDKAIKKRLS